MSQPELLARVVEVLNSLGINFFVTGSHASAVFGQPRSTHDIDVVVEMKPAAVSQLVAAFPPPSYLLQEQSIREAIRHRSMFNLLSLDDGEKVDFWQLTDEPFDRSAFARRRPITYASLTFPVSTPEDTILSKLRWAKLCGGSEKQMGDVRGVMEVQRESLDVNYLQYWAHQLGVEKLLQQIQNP